MVHRNFYDAPLWRTHLPISLAVLPQELLSDTVTARGSNVLDGCFIIRIFQLQNNIHLNQHREISQRTITKSTTFC